MEQASGGSVKKAWFQSADESSYWFEVQYNPVNFQFNKPVSWAEHADQGQAGSLEFQKVTPASMSCELLFDTTRDSSDVRFSWVNKLLKFTNPEVKPKEGQAGQLSKERPHKVRFVWGEFHLLGVIEGLDVSYLMFSPEGTPLRAKVSVKMKEWTSEDSYSGDQTAIAGYGSAPVELVTVKPGDTITSIAQQQGVDWRELADQNSIDDPFDGISAGESVVVIKD